MQGLLQYISEDEKCKILICTSSDGFKGNVFFSSLRFIDNLNIDPSLLHSIFGQCLSLENKIKFVETNRLSPIIYSDKLICGRIFVLIESFENLNYYSKFLNECFQAFEDQTGYIPIIQSDYDQLLLNKKISNFISPPKFALTHLPSAYSTMIPFAINLQRLECSEPLIGIYGMGNLGKELIGLLLKRVPDAKLIFTDIDSSKRRALGDYKNIEWIDIDYFYSKAYTAVIYCANHGSLNTESLSQLIKMPSLKLIGGPEAGLDSNLDMISTLESKGIIFIPSKLCGVLGIITNLLEIFKITYDLAELVETYTAFLEKILAKDQSLYNVCYF